MKSKGMNRPGIYVIRHVASGRTYVGQAQSIRDRWIAHKSFLKRGAHHAKFLQNCWRKHGADAFAFSVLEFCDVESLAVREQHWMDELRPVFNTAPIAGTTRGVKHAPRSAEFRAKMSKMRRGTKASPEALVNIRKANAERVQVWTPEMRAAKSVRFKAQREDNPEKWAEASAKGGATRTGRKQSAEWVAKRSTTMRSAGRSCPDHVKAACAASNSARLLGTKQSAELIEKRVAPLRGKKRPENLISALHAERDRHFGLMRAARVEACREFPHLNITQLSKVLGCSHKTARYARRQLLCRPIAPPNVNAATVKNSRPEQARLFA